MPFGSNFFSRLLTRSALSAQSALVDGTVPGFVYRADRQLGAGSVFSLTSASNSNFTISGTDVSVTNPIGAGNTQVAIIRESLNQIAIEYPLTIQGQPSALPDLNALSLSNTSSLMTLVASNGTIAGATSGSTITASGLPSGFTINSANRTWAYDGTGSSGTFNITLTETLVGRNNSPKSTVVLVTIALNPASIPQVYTPSVVTAGYPTEQYTSTTLLAS